MKFAVFGLAVFILFSTFRQAAAIAVSDYSVAETNPAAAGYSLDWDYVYNYQYATAAAVDHYWLLTAAHVADDGKSTTNLTINGELYTQQEIVFHDEADLALIRYDKPFPGYYPLLSGEIYTAATNILPGVPGPPLEITKTYDELVMVGYGYAGAVTNDSFTQSGTHGVKRWGTNRGEWGDYEASVDVGGTAGERTTTFFYLSFSLEDTDYEAGGNIYDSGGPCFIERDGEWKLAGISLLREGDNPYTGNYAAQLSEYVGWITNTVPDYDSDMDGLPDWWESATGETEAEADPDGDGFTNYEEWIADTDPVEETSQLRLGSYTNAAVLQFSSSTNREYVIESCASLFNQEWQTEIDWFSAAQTQTVQAVAAAATNRFYRVRVKLP